MSYLLSPSILNADFGELNKAVGLINKSEADWIHLDIMDGVFVPNISFGFPVVETIKKVAKKPLDVHLMIIDPDNYIKKFKDAGADILTVHIETCKHLHRTIQEIKSSGMKAGVSLNPHTPVHLLEDILHDIDMVLLMTVNPGFGGQKFIPHSFEKVSKLKKMISDRQLSTKIEVDGGVDLSNAKQLIDKGANILVVGSFIFKSEDPEKTIGQLKKF